MKIRTKLTGFTLLEILLVLVIVSSIILMLITYTTTKTDESKRDFTVVQSEQILNAGLAYYINNSTWPTSIAQLQTDKYLPNKIIRNPWRGNYVFYSNLTTGTFSICTQISGAGSGSTYTSGTEAAIIAGRLPLAYVTTSCPNASAPLDPATCTGATCAVVTTVNIPGQNLNNARSVNFAGLYHNGACVPAPVCPNPYSASNPTGMKPAIIVAPVAVSGNFEGDSKVFPLSSFTAYAVGKVDNPDKGSPTRVPGWCTNTTVPDFCSGVTGSIYNSGLYWRVCLEVVTERGKISGTTWNANSGTVMAITRCIPNNEPAGSNFTVFQPY